MEVTLFHSGHSLYEDLQLLSGHLEATHHVRSMNTLRAPSWEKSKPQEEARGMRSHVEGVSRHADEETILEGYPPASATIDNVCGSELNSPPELFSNF